MNRIMIASTAAAACFITGSAMAQPMTLVQGAQPGSTSSLFTAVGTSNNGNAKAYLDAAGQSRVQGGNPGTGWWTNPSTPRSYTVDWNNTTGVVTFVVYSDTNYTNAVMTMTQTPTFGAGNTLLGIAFQASVQRNAGTLPWTVEFTNTEFNDGSGFVGVATANALYSSDNGGFFSNYHAITGTLGSFTVKPIEPLSKGQMPCEVEGISRRRAPAALARGASTPLFLIGAVNS